MLLDKIRLRESHDERRKNFQVAKKMFEDKLLENKCRMGPIILERCDMQHEARLLSKSVPLTETHKRIMLELFTLAISRYADVRSKAQTSLSYALQYFPCSFMVIMPRLIEVLAKDTEEHHDAYKVTKLHKLCLETVVCVQKCAQRHWGNIYDTFMKLFNYSGCSVHVIRAAK